MYLTERGVQGDEDMADPDDGELSGGFVEPQQETVSERAFP